MDSAGRKRAERRLAAILAADVAGYSRLIGADEEGTLTALREIRREVVDPAIVEHRGRLVKTTGDGFLIEFASVVDAVRCAVAWQSAVAERGSAGIRFRIGINVGDIVVEDGDIFGDGVNVAARLEGLAAPGGICVSARVQEDAAGRLDLAFEYLGEQELRNIARPVRVYRVVSRDPHRGPPPVAGEGERQTPSAEPPPQAGAARVGAAAAAAPALALPDKPSLAVLPFDNMSGDPEQEYFADGMVEEITAALSRVRDFFVIARNSAFTYKGRTVSAQQAGSELGVRYLIEGSVRRAGNRVRITAQLINAQTGNHLWADRYDGALTDVFDLQDRITESVVGAIQPSIRSAEIERSRRERPDSLAAYDFVLRAYPGVWSLERTANTEALELLDQAIAIEPRYALALALAAWCHGQQVVYNWAADPGASRAEVLRLAQMALASSGGNDPTILSALGAAHSVIGNLDIAARLLEKGLALDPNSAWAWNRSGWLQCYLGHPEVGIEHFERCLRLSPLDPMNFNAFVGTGAAHLTAERYAQAIPWYERGLIEQPGAIWIYRHLVALYALVGRQADAQAALQKLLGEYPGLTVSEVMTAIAPMPQPTRDRQAEGLRLAGMPE